MKVNGSTRALTFVDVFEGLVILHLSSPVTEGQTVTVSYAVPATTPLQDAAGNKAAAFTDQAVRNVVIDPKIVLSGTSLTVPEGGSATYTVKLSRRPSAIVTVAVTGATGDITVAPTSLTSTDTTAQTVTVSAADDADDVDDDATLTHTATSGDTHYSGLTATVDVTVKEPGKLGKVVLETRPPINAPPTTVTEGQPVVFHVISLEVLPNRQLSPLACKRAGELPVPPAKHSTSS